MAKTKKSKNKKVYTVNMAYRDGYVEGKRIWKRKHDAARKALLHEGFVTEYELVKVSDLLVIKDETKELKYVPKTPEADLLYGKT